LGARVEQGVRRALELEADRAVVHLVDRVDEAAQGLPKLSRAGQRMMLATTSRAATCSPSWNFRPSHRRINHARPSSETVCPSAMCRLGRSWEAAA
jgi:hypothetical protein